MRNTPSLRSRVGRRTLAGVALTLCSVHAPAQGVATSSTSQAVAGAVGASGSSVSQASGSLRASLTPLVATSSATPLPLPDGYQTITASAALTGGAVTSIQGAASNVSQGAGTGSAQSTGSARALLPHTMVQGGVQGATQYIDTETGIAGAGIVLPWALVSGSASSQAQALISSGTDGAASLSAGAAGTVNQAMNVILTITSADVDFAVVTPTNASQNSVQPTVQSQSGSGQVVLPGGPVAAGAVSESTAAGDGISFRQAF